MACVFFFFSLYPFFTIVKQTWLYFTLNNVSIHVASTPQWFILFRREKFTSYFRFFSKFNLNIISWYSSCYSTGTKWSGIRLERLLTRICRVKNSLETFFYQIISAHLCIKWIYIFHILHWKLMTVLIYSLQVCSLTVYSCLILLAVIGKLLAWMWKKKFPCGKKIHVFFLFGAEFANKSVRWHTKIHLINE